MNARLRPMSAPTLPPLIMSIAMTSVYAVIAPCMPLTVVPMSSATVAIETFITELSRAIRNCPAARVSRMSLAFPAFPSFPAGAAFAAVMGAACHAGERWHGASPGRSVDWRWARPGPAQAQAATALTRPEAIASTRRRWSRSFWSA
ncbi:hypothetical protein GCM10020254_14250 [Streptomyces goshikiensis]